jgi:Lar family restriction alleviation protein
MKNKPCPFCGEEESSFQSYLAHGYFECDSCDAKGPPSTWAMVNIKKCKAEAKKLWNERKINKESE